MHHDDPASLAAAGAGWFEIAVGAGLIVAAVAYAECLWFSRHRARPPVRRILFWYAGLTCCAVATIGPVAASGRDGFTGHMVVHLLLGMIAPLLLVRAAPMTLLLRALPVVAARQVARLLRTRALRAITHPLTATLLNLGGLWILYFTGVFQAMHGFAPVHAAVHLHLLAVGYLFTASLVGVDPDPHRASVVIRSGALIAFMAGHSALAKQLYVTPPAGVGIVDGRSGAQLMYYAGDAVDVALIVLLLAGWYSAAGRRAAGPGAPQALRAR
ncbi:cytochrome c oxidase assembly protein [Kineosporia sp. J2-2]|uniref:Cytochrome c oxidase assembly protein n=1 Tax=Kineosporia corallincola TaxID=2835133 RepID=A0ABS5TGF1_9ACTN|nr:cytochrome c oxidase assembly protein [Kineosporia corallincola]MBT0770164.1 cytochrome c oxidase assembly protein [Kineosporia corallincola]